MTKNYFLVRAGGINFPQKCFLFLIFIILRILSINNSFSQSTVSGFVTESRSGETVVGSTVAIYKDTSGINKKLLRGSYTNKFGFYSIPNIPEGECFLICSGVGYKNRSQKINLAGKPLEINIKLQQVDIKLNEVTVESKREINTTKTISLLEIEPDMILKIPSLGGEKDVFKALHLLPGVKQVNELSCGLYVRGGSPDQNLILLDGVTVYNPSHLGGFLSTFNADALKDIRLLKGSFPAEYGGRVSSVLDMTMKEGTAEKFSGSGGISLINSRLTFEGPINENSTFMISGRRMYLDAILALAYPKEEIAQYYFYDLNAKINYKIGEHDKIFLSGFFNRDVLASSENESADYNINWGNSTLNARWMHVLSSNLFSNFSLIHTDYQFNTHLYDPDNESNNFNSISQIRDLSGKAEIQYFPDEEHLIKAGFETILHSVKLNSSINIMKNISIPLNELKEDRTIESNLYFQDEWKVSPLFITNLGGRVSYFDKTNSLNFEPRLSCSYALTDKFSVKASIANANQFFHMVMRNEISLPTDLWFPSSDKIFPIRSWQGTLGFETQINEGEYFISGEAYYKSLNNIYDYKDSAAFALGAPLESQLLKGKGKAYGFELFINKRFGAFTGWLGYTLSWTKHYFDELNNGKPFYPRYDRRHDISLVLAYKPSEKWEFGISWVYGTGQPYTFPSGIYYMQTIGPSNASKYYGNQTIIGKYRYTEWNGMRLPAFHKLDINAMYRYEWFGLPFEFSINIYNAYNHLNPFAWYIDHGKGGTENKENVIHQVTLFPIIPTFGLSFKF